LLAGTYVLSIGNLTDIYHRSLIMSIIQDYFETEQEREEGHVDTRKQNFECENKDPYLGCDLGIDVQG
jgi:hypothetical protein